MKAKRELYSKELVSGELSETVDGKWIIKTDLYSGLVGLRYILYTATHDTLSAAIDDMAVQLNKEVTE